MAKNISYETRQKIIAQALQEIAFARQYKQGKVQNWKINEDLYYGRKYAAEASRANVDLGQMQSHVHTILSKVDEALIFKYTKRKDSQLMRVNRLNGLRMYDQDRDNWDIKDLVGKKQAVIYGRAIYAYYADSVNGYMPHLENVDVYDFLIDPSAGGIDIEKAQFLGDYGVVLTKEQIKAGVKSGIYLRTEANNLISGGSNATDSTTEETNKLNRTADQNTYQTQKEISNSDKYKFWRWGTTFEGERYFLLITDTGGTAIEVCPLEEKFESKLWWYWTYAAFPDLTEFWTPSFCDYVRETIMAQAVSINQMLDNGEQVNKPQRFVNTSALENLAQLKYRREGWIYVKKDFDATKIVQPMTTPSISTPLLVFDRLETIKEKSSGVTAGDSGAADNNSGAKATIYKGNQANSADRFGLFNKTYAFGYKRFAKLYEWGVREHLVKKIAIDILGPDGIKMEEIARKDIFWKTDQFGVMVEASNAEIALSTEDRDAKLKFLTAQSANPSAIQNPKKAYEMEASIVGFKEEEIRQLLDTSEFGDADLMAEADRDIELILDGQIIEPNPAATTAYMQRILDYMTNNQEAMDKNDNARMEAYFQSLEPIVMRNMIKQANQTLMQQKLKAALATQTSPAQAPVVPGQEGVAPVVAAATQ